jgi:hypothetical protein
LRVSRENPVSKFAFKWVNLCRYRPDTRKEVNKLLDKMEQVCTVGLRV